MLQSHGIPHVFNFEDACRRYSTFRAYTPHPSHPQTHACMSPVCDVRTTQANVDPCQIPLISRRAGSRAQLHAHPDAGRQPHGQGHCQRHPGHRGHGQAPAAGEHARHGCGSTRLHVQHLLVHTCWFGADSVRSIHRLPWGNFAPSSRERAMTSQYSNKHQVAAGNRVQNLHSPLSEHFQPQPSHEQLACEASGG